MKRFSSTKIRWLFLITLLLSLAPLLYASVGCGGSTAPISIPAPTGGYINGSAPNSAGKVVIFGYIDANGTKVANATVSVANTTQSITAATATDANGKFSVEIVAAVGNVISVTYVDPATGRTSPATTLTISELIQPMTSITMVAEDVDMGSGGYAYAVANDGTNSEILEIDMTTGVINTRATFANKLFDKIAVHTGLDYAAVLDTTNGVLYWYNLAVLADEMAATSTDTSTEIVYDVAVVSLDDSVFTTDDFVIVGHYLNALNTSIATTYPIGTGATPSLGTGYNVNCIAHPDAAGYPTCSMGSYIPTATTYVSLMKDPDNKAHLAIVAEYYEGATNYKAAHFLFVSQPSGTGTSISFNITAGYASIAFDNSEDPWDLRWYDDDIAIISDDTNGALLTLEESGGAITDTSVSVGSNPRGVYPDPDNGRSFIAEQTSDTIINVNMTTMQVESTTYNAQFDPTYIVYYESGATANLGMILTDPEPLFKTLNTN